VVLPGIVVAGSWWLALALIARSSMAPFRSAWEGNLFLVAFAGVSLAGLLVDFFCLAMAGGAISRDIDTGRWTLLRLTLLNEESMLRAKHAGVRLRAWRLLQVVAGLRCGIGVMVAIEYLNFRYFSSLEVLLSIALFMLVFVPYVLEPFWRTQAFTTVGLYFSAFNLSSKQTLLMAAFGLLVLWLIQAVFVGSVMYILVQGVVLLYNARGSTYYLWPDFVVTGLLSACFWLLNYGFYARLERLSWMRTLRQLTRMEA